MAESKKIIKALEIPISTSLNERQMFEVKKRITEFASQYQEQMKIQAETNINNEQIEKSLKDAVDQINKVLKANNLTGFNFVDFKDFDKPFEELGKRAVQSFMDGFSVSGNAMNAILEVVDQIESRLSAVSKYGSKTMTELQDAGARFLEPTKKGKPSKSAKAVNDALSYDAKISISKNGQVDTEKVDKAVNNLIRLFNANINTSTNPKSTWEEQYSADVKFIKYYEAFSKSLTQSGQSMSSAFGENAEALGQIESLFKTLSSSLNDKINMLRNIQEFNPQNPKAFNYGYNTGEPWAREDTLQEIKNILSGGIKIDGSTKENKSSNNQNEIKTIPIADDEPQKNNNTDSKVSNTKNVKAEGEIRAKILNVLKEFIPKTSFKSDEEEDKYYKMLEQKKEILLTQIAPKGTKKGDKTKISDLLSDIIVGDMATGDIDGRIDEIPKSVLKNFIDFVGPIKNTPNDSTTTNNTSENARLEQEAAEAAKTRADANKESASANKESSEAIRKLLADTSKNEKFIYIDTKTGETSDYITGSESGIKREDAEKLLNGNNSFNATLHTHPENIAAPSGDEADLQTFYDNFDKFKRNFILAGEQLAEIDFSSLTKDVVDKIKNIFIEKESDLSVEFDDRFFDIPIKDIGNITEEVYEKFYELFDVNAQSALAKTAENNKIGKDVLNQIIEDYSLNLESFFDSEDIGNITRGDLADRFYDIAKETLSSYPKEIQKILKSGLSGNASDIFESVTGIKDTVQNKMQEAIQGIFIETLQELNLDPSQIFKLYNIKDFDFGTFMPKNSSTTPNVDDKANTNYDNVDAIKAESKARLENADAIEVETQKQLSLNEKLEKTRELERLLSESYMSIDDPYGDSNLEAETERLKRIKQLWIEITGEVEGDNIKAIDFAISELDIYAKKVEDINRWLKTGEYDSIDAVRDDGIFDELGSPIENIKDLSSQLNFTSTYDIEDQIEAETKSRLENADAAKVEAEAVKKSNGEKEKSAVITEDKNQTPITENPSSRTPQNDIAPMDAGIEQNNMVELAGSVDGITSAINAKTEAFQIEQNEVDKIVDHEKSKLEELQKVLENIVVLIDNIKSDVNLENGLSNVNLNANYPEKQDSEISLSNNSITSLASTIKEAFRTTEIPEEYHKISQLSDIFIPDLGSFGEMMNMLTGEIMSEREAQEDFDKFYANMYMHSRDGYIDVLTRDEVLDRIQPSNSNNNNWAQVIVDAINTQGGNIIQALKVIPSENAMNNNDDSQLTNAFQTLTQAISEWNTRMQTKPKDFFNSILGKNNWNVEITPEINNALKTLGMLSNDNKPTFNLNDTGLRNLGVAIADKFVLPSRESDLDQTSKLIPLLDEANKLGASVPRIISAFNDGVRVFDLQTRMPGQNIASSKSNGEFFDATDEQIDRLIHTFEVMNKVGLYPDFVGDNIMFDKNKGFSLIDLETEDINEYYRGISTDTVHGMIEAFLSNILYNEDVGYSDGKFSEFENRIRERFELPSRKRLVNANTIATEQQQGSQQEMLISAKVTPVMDEGAVANSVTGNVSKTPAVARVIPVVDELDIPDITSKYSINSNAPWALEDTMQQSIIPLLQRIAGEDGKDEGQSTEPTLSREVIDQLTTTLSNIRITGEFDTEGLATQETVSTIADIVKSINDKIVQGTKIVEKDTKHTASTDTSNEHATDLSKKEIKEDGTIIHGHAEGEKGSLRKLVDYYYWLEEQMLQFKDNTKYVDKIKKVISEIETKIAENYNSRWLDILHGDRDFNIDELDDGTRNPDGSKKSPNWILSLNEKHDLHNARIQGGEEIVDNNLDEKYALDLLKDEYKIKSDISKLEKDGATEEQLAPLRERLALYEDMRETIETIIRLDPQLYSRYTEKADDIKRKAETKDITNDTKFEVSEAHTEQKQREAEIVKQLIELYKQLGAARAKDDTDEASRIRGEIKTKRGNLSYVDYATDMKFKTARESGFNAEKTKQENDALREQEQLATKLKGLYETLGKQQAIMEAANLGAEYDKAKSNYDKTFADILNSGKSSALDAEEEARIYREAYTNQQRIIANEKKIAEEKKATAEATKSQNESEKQRKNTIKEIEGLYDKLGVLDAKIMTSTSDDEAEIYRKQIAELEQIIDLKSEELGIDKEAMNTRRADSRRGAMDKSDVSQAKAGVRQSRQAAKFGKVSTVIENSELLQGKFGAIQSDFGIDPKENQTVNAFTQSLKRLSELYKKLYNQDGVISDDDIRNLRSARDETEGYRKQVQALVNEMALADNQEDTEKFVTGNVSSYKNQLTQMANEMTNGKAVIGDFDAKTNTLNYTLKTGTREITNYTLSVRGMDKGITQTTVSVSRMENFLDAIKRKTKEISTYLVGSGSIYKVFNAIKQGVSYVREIDSALTELKKVTDETEETYDKFLQTASKTASTVGSTIKEVVSSTADFARLGYALEDAAELAKNAQILMNVSEFTDISTATDTLISAIQAFSYTADESMHVVDIMNTIGNNYAISTADLATSLTRSSAALVAAGNTMEEAVAMTSAANTIIQDADSVGKKYCRH